MKYVVSSIPELVLSETNEQGEFQSKSAPSARLYAASHLEFDFEPFTLFPSPRRRTQKFLSFLSLGLSNRIANQQLLQTFQEIDRENRGEITRDDLIRYATKNRLPSDYVEPFFSKIDSDSDSINFKQFRRFVSSKEEALKRAFGLFDADGDGRIDAADLEVSLSHVRVCCPQSKCNYRCRKNCIRELVAKIDINDDKEIEFWEFRKFFLLLPQNKQIMEYWLNSKCSERCDVGGCVVIHDGDKHVKRDDQTNPWGHLFAGAVAGATSRTATAPLETLRLNAMTGAIPPGLSPIEAARSVCQKDGWKSLYKGNLTNVLRSAPQKALDFFAFDAFKRILSKGSGQTGTLGTFAAAGLAGATSNVLLYPLEVIRSRLTVAPSGTYKGVLDAFSQISRKEGVGGLYRGVGPSVAAILPEAAIVYGLFDLSKKAYTNFTGREPGIVQSLSFGVWSAFMGQVVAYPLETISRRMQVQGMKGGQIGFASCAKEIVRTDGLAGLYRGLGAASARVIPMAIASFGTYELVRRLVKEAEDAVDRAKARQEYNAHHCCGHVSAVAS